jgi:hypothetical protein
LEDNEAFKPTAADLAKEMSHRTRFTMKPSDSRSIQKEKEKHPLNWKTCQYSFWLQIGPSCSIPMQHLNGLENRLVCILV